MPIASLREFLRLEAAGGIVLIIAAFAALLIANSPFKPHYLEFLNLRGAIEVGPLAISKPLLLWVNDLWMAIFFFLIGLEIKREVLVGQFSRRSDLLLPISAAAGGLVTPAAIYVFLNWDSSVHLNGWAIPAATDIAFALGILALLGSRAPISLKVLLTAIAIIDDLGAIIIIAVFYTNNLSLVALAAAAVACIGLVLLNMLRVSHVAAYVILGAVLWVCVLKSGVHATLAGVITALAIPLDANDKNYHLEHSLHPWVAFLILPTFAFANAGISFQGITFASFLEPVPLGIAAGLVLGKQIGVFVPLWICIRFGLAQMPSNSSWMQLYAVSVLCGIGFTMSLFIGSLAFEPPEFEAPVRIGVLSGSIVCAVVGYVMFRLAAANRGNTSE